MKKFEINQRLLQAFHAAPYPSLKATNYFPIYTELFGHLINESCTFIETGVLNGGSLFMWRSWLGPKARIIGIDLNPAAQKWRNHGFEIYIGDQGSLDFWHEILPKIGLFDAFLDDGGHQSFQQIVTLTAAMKYLKPEGVIAIEDTVSSHMSEFSDHMARSFLEYAKDSTDVLSAKNSQLWPDQYPKIRNQEIVDDFASIFSIHFYSGIVAYKASSKHNISPELIWNKVPTESEPDFRHRGLTKSAHVLWPDPFMSAWIEVHGRD